MRLRSATFWWISLLAKRVRAESPADHEHLGLGGADPQRALEDLLGQLQGRTRAPTR